MCEAHRERERGRESGGEIAGSGGGVRSGVWHPLSCLLKASFFPSLPPPHAADRKIFPRASLCRSVPTSQAAGRVTEVETGGCQSPVSLRDPRETSRKKAKRSAHVCRHVCACVCVHVLAAEHNLCARVRLLMKPG